MAATLYSLLQHRLHILNRHYHPLSTAPPSVATAPSSVATAPPSVATTPRRSVYELTAVEAGASEFAGFPQSSVFLAFLKSAVEAGATEFAGYWQIFFTSGEMVKTNQKKSGSPFKKDPT